MVLSYLALKQLPPAYHQLAQDPTSPETITTITTALQHLYEALRVPPSNRPTWRQKQTICPGDIGTSACTWHKICAYLQYMQVQRCEVVLSRIHGSGSRQESNENLNREVRGEECFCDDEVYLRQVQRGFRPVSGPWPHKSTRLARLPWDLDRTFVKVCRRLKPALKSTEIHGGQRQGSKKHPQRNQQKNCPGRPCGIVRIHANS